MDHHNKPAFRLFSSRIQKKTRNAVFVGHTCSSSSRVHDYWCCAVQWKSRVLFGLAGLLQWPLFSAGSQSFFTWVYSIDADLVIRCLPGCQETEAAIALCSVCFNYTFHSQGCSTLNQVILGFKVIPLNVLCRLLAFAHFASLQSKKMENCLLRAYVDWDLV